MKRTLKIGQSYRNNANKYYFEIIEYHGKDDAGYYLFQVLFTTFPQGYTTSQPEACHPTHIRALPQAPISQAAKLAYML